MIRFFLSLIVFTIMCSTNAAAQTNITTSDVRGLWTKARSPYILSGFITVRSPDTLRIEAGVKIKFSGSTQFLVEGKLFANGALGDTVEFSAVGPFGRDDVAQIFFQDTTNLGDSSLMNYCKVTDQIGVIVDRTHRFRLSNSLFTGYNGTNSRTLAALKIYKSNITIQNTAFENTESFYPNNYNAFAVWCTGFKVAFKNCTFKRTGGIKFTSDYTQQSYPLLESCGFSENSPRCVEYEYNLSPTIRNCVFEKTLANSIGGVLFFRPQGPTDTAIIENNIFRNNAVDSILGNIEAGVAIFARNFNFLDIKNNLFEGNNARIREGGVIYLEGARSEGHLCKVNITDCRFHNNLGGYGAAIGVKYRVKPTINRCTFTNNWSKYDGGALRLAEMAVDSTNFIIANCLFANNSAFNPSYFGSYGGAIYLYEAGHGRILNSTFANNWANDTGVISGGAIRIYNYQNVVRPQRMVEITNSIFYGNRAKVTYQSSNTLSSNLGIIYNPNSQNDTLRVNNACFEGGRNSIASLASGTSTRELLILLQNSTSANPQFVALSLTAGTSSDGRLANFQLSRGRSPVINRGLLNSDTVNIGKFDLNGQQRVQGDTIDIGAYESKPVTLPEIVSQTNGTTTVCAGTKVVFRVSVLSLAPLTYTWLRNGVTVGGNTDSLVIVSPNVVDTGNYTCRIANSFGNATTQPQFLIVNALPILNLVNISDSLCQNGADVTLGATPAGGLWAGRSVTNNRFSPTTAGIGSHWLVYSFTDNKGCTGRDSIKVNVRNCRVSLQGVLESAGVSVSIFPNPSYSSDVNLTVKTAKNELVRVEMFDFLGQFLGVLLENTAVLGEKSFIMPLPPKTNQMLLKIKVGENVFYQKLIHF